MLEVEIAGIQACEDEATTYLQSRKSEALRLSGEGVLLDCLRQRRLFPCKTYNDRMVEAN